MCRFSIFFQKLFFVLLITALAGTSQITVAQVSLSSPDKKIVVQVTTEEGGKISYSVMTGQTEILRKSSLGMVLDIADLSTGFSFVKASPVEPITDAYNLAYGKKLKTVYTANKTTLQFKKQGGAIFEITFQVSNDGVAFRYELPGNSDRSGQMISERTSFHFPLSAKAWLQPMQVSKSGWEQTNPAYEEHYVQNVPVGTAAPTPAGWVYPALFRCNDVWALITEASVDSLDCATRLKAESPDGEYTVGLPDPREITTGKGLLPRIKLPYTSPWRIITIGSLATIIESTLGTDLAKPAMGGDFSYVKPGKASWSWINSKDDFIVYDEQKKYIDFAAEMHWQYCLVDADWDRKIGYEKIKELAAYAKTKNVGLLLWYNSAGDWNTVKYTPKNKLLTHESRMAEFRRLKEMGIMGVKIDFFAGDGQSVMAYYQEILKDAADAQLMVNFHGATLPRGWSRTWPNLVTTEAVRGFEMVTFEQKDADLQPTHCAMLPFTRNAFDPMDFTPMNLVKIPTKVVRQTSSAFELALSVLFLSGIQHYAESPDGMQQVPAFVKSFLQQLPDTWEEVKYIDGFPGEYVVIARKSKGKWYIAGINGSKTARQIELNTAAFGKKTATLITDGATMLTFAQSKLAVKAKQSVTMGASGGFVMVLE